MKMEGKCKTVALQVQLFLGQNPKVCDDVTFQRDCLHFCAEIFTFIPEFW